MVNSKTVTYFGIYWSVVYVPSTYCILCIRALSFMYRSISCLLDTYHACMHALSFMYWSIASNLGQVLYTFVVFFVSNFKVIPQKTTVTQKISASTKSWMHYSDTLFCHKGVTNQTIASVHLVLLPTHSCRKGGLNTSPTTLGKFLFWAHFRLRL